MATVRVQPEAFDISEECDALANGRTDIGGVTCFVGRVRGEQGLTSLTIEHYPGMTERTLTSVATAAEVRFDLLECTIIHRFGRLAVGAPIVLVATAARHRAASLEATQFLIDWLKVEAPFWKHEERDDGSTRWVSARQSDEAARASWLSPSTKQ